MNNWNKIETAVFNDQLALVYWNDAYITLEDFSHDSNVNWWKSRGAVLWQEVVMPDEKTLSELNLSKVI